MSFQSSLLKDLSFIEHGFGTIDDELPISPRVLMKQVHGVHCETVSGKQDLEIPSCDAIMTRERGLALVVKTADCEPILLCDPEAKVIAAVHAGWKGCLQGIGPKTVEKMIEQGAKLERIRAVLGPCLQEDCFEIGDDVVAAFKKEYPHWDFITPSRSGAPGKYQLNMHRYNREQLSAMGVRHIDELNHCTYCHPELFYSYRRGDIEKRLYHYIKLL